MKDKTTKKEHKMFENNEIGLNLTSAIGGAAMVVSSAVDNAANAVKNAHPGILTAAGVIVASSVITPLLIDGDKVHPDSLYSIIFKRNK